MTERLGLFPAILCVCLSLAFFDGFSLFGLFLSVIWLVRIFRLHQRTIFIQSVVIGLLFISVGFVKEFHNETELTGSETSFIVYPKTTSILVDGNRVRFEGVIQEKTFNEKVMVTYYLETEMEQKIWQDSPPTEFVSIEGGLEEPAEQSNFHQFDYQDYLNRQNIHWQLQAETIEPITHEELTLPFVATIERIRQQLFEMIDSNFETKIASYIKILFFADDRYFSEEMLQHFRSLGVIHLFSISGFHITYLISMIKRFLLRVGFTHEQTNVWLIIILPLYGILTGFGVSVFRAVFQNLFIRVSALRKRPMDTMDAWALTMLLALFIQPTQIYHIAFQLSYSLSGLFILMGKQKWTKSLSSMQHALLFSLMSGIVSVPILSYHFFEISWITILSNVLFIPLFSNVLFPLLLILFLIGLVFSGFFLFSLFEQIVLVVFQFIESLLTLLGSTFDFTLVTGRLPIWVMFLLILCIFQVLCKMERKESPAILTILVMGCSLFYYALSPVGYVTMLDVGQGDSILIKEPGTGNITLIDTGGQLKWGNEEAWKQSEDPFSIGADVIVPALKVLGISSIDRLYITHADADHSGEIKSIAEVMPIQEVAATKSTFYDPFIYEQLLTNHEMKRVLIEPLEKLTYPTKQTLALHPGPTAFYQENNNQSLVLYVTLGEDKWLFTGDIEEKVERQLISDYPNLLVDYLKVSHHGSQTSSTEAFIEQVKPKAALISAGENNRFGHPHADVIDRFKSKDIPFYLTSEHGAIMYRYFRVPFTDKWLKDVTTVREN